MKIEICNLKDIDLKYKDIFLPLVKKNIESALIKNGFREETVTMEIIDQKINRENTVIVNAEFARRIYYTRRRNIEEVIAMSIKVGIFDHQRTVRVVVKQPAADDITSQFGLRMKREHVIKD